MSSDLQGVLKAATEIKAVQLKERPGRRLWEEAPEFLKLTAHTEPEIIATRRQSVSDKLQLCRKLKQEGNQLYEQDDPEAALRKYASALSVFVWFDRGEDNTSEDIPYVNSITSDNLPEGPHKDEINGLLAAVFNNAASCLFKLQRTRDAGYIASKALEHDPYNVKALYRRAHAMHDEGTRAGLEQAVQDLKTAVALEPNNSQVRSALQQFQRELVEQNRKDSTLYEAMLSSGNLYAENGAKQIPSAGHDDDTADMGRDRSQDPSHSEVQRAMQGMQRNMRAAQGRPPHRQPVIITPDRSPFSYVPWWAWALILTHLIWRIFRVWSSLPVPTVRMHGAGMKADEHAHGHIEL